MIRTEATCAHRAEPCSICGDRADTVRVLRSTAMSAVVADAQGHRREISTALLGATRPGERLLIHAGVALARLEEA